MSVTYPQRFPHSTAQPAARRLPVLALLLVAILLAALVLGFVLLTRNKFHATMQHRDPAVGTLAASTGDLPPDVLATLQKRGAGSPPAFVDNSYVQNRLLSSVEPGFSEQENAAIALGQPFESQPHAHPDEPWANYQVPTPGMSLDIDGEYSCTLGFFGHYADSHQQVALTAGHCMQSDSDGVVEWSPAQDGYPLLPLGHWDAMQPLDDPDVTVSATSQRYHQQHYRAPQPFPSRLDADYATLSVENRLSIDPRIDGRYRVVTVAGPADLRPGMTVCKMGYRTQETCGTVVSWNASMVRTTVYSLQGDSGSPLYLRLGGDKVAALGILSSSPQDADSHTTDYVTDFALIQPVLEKTNIKLW